MITRTPNKARRHSLSLSAAKIKPPAAPIIWHVSEITKQMLPDTRNYDEMATARDPATSLAGAEVRQPPPAASAAPAGISHAL